MARIAHIDNSHIAFSKSEKIVTNCLDCPFCLKSNGVRNEETRFCILNDIYLEPTKGIPDDCHLEWCDEITAIKIRLGYEYVKIERQVNALEGITEQEVLNETP